LFQNQGFNIGQKVKALSRYAMDTFKSVVFGSGYTAWSKGYKEPMRKKLEFSNHFL
jgi:hypothetical protein